MGAVIIYMSRHGSAEKSAKLLKEKVHGDVTLVNLKHDKVPDLNQFDSVIIGGSIHAGKVQDRIKKFCNQNEESLIKKRLGLYLCCMKRGEEAQHQFLNAYSDTLRKHAEVRGIFGGEFMFEKMNFLEKMIVRKVAGVKENVSDIKYDLIDNFAADISRSSSKDDQQEKEKLYPSF